MAARLCFGTSYDLKHTGSQFKSETVELQASQQGLQPAEAAFVSVSTITRGYTNKKKPHLSEGYCLNVECRN